ncbi:MAG: tetratricopeptide repeat protein [Rariglobus sp.]
MSKSQHPDDRPDRLDEDSLSSRVKRRLARVQEKGPRDLWWQFLDVLEKHTVFRRSLYAVVILGGVGVVGGVWIYPWWRERTAVSMAQQWLAAGRLQQASESIQEALRVAPQEPESWKLAADLARRLGNQSSALGYSKQAASLAPKNLPLILAWASDALIENQMDEAERALATASAEQVAQSSHAQRILGEIARRRLQLSEARDHFETALRIDGPNTAINEVPLGVVLLNARGVGERKRGEDLLIKWTTSIEWGANALRTLLQDALLNDDRVAMARWADMLRAHPRCTLADIPQCLLALSKTDQTHFQKVILTMQRNHSVDPENVALLLGWMNQIGRPEEGLAWVRSLPDSLTRRPPAIVVVSESLRISGAWSELEQWTAGPTWQGSLEFIQLIYRMESALRLGKTSEAAAIRRSLESKAVGNGGQALFAASSLYAWGRVDEAVALLWVAADQRGHAVEALGTLARHYHEQRDASGQYQVFRRLRPLRADDAAVGNNFAFFAALMGQDLISAGAIADNNFRSSPENRIWRSTHSFVLLKRNQAAKALAVMEPLASDWKEYPAVAFAYGLALAANGDKAQARTILGSQHPETLAKEEQTLISASIK